MQISETQKNHLVIVVFVIVRMVDFCCRFLGVVGVVLFVGASSCCCCCFVVLLLFCCCCCLPQNTQPKKTTSNKTCLPSICGPFFSLLFLFIILFFSFFLSFLSCLFPSFLSSFSVFWFSSLGSLLLFNFFLCFFLASLSVLLFISFIFFLSFLSFLFLSSGSNPPMCPLAFQIRFWFFKKMTQIVPNMGNYRAIWKLLVLATSRVISLSTFWGQKWSQKVDKLISQVAKLITFNLLLAAVRMRFWQNGGQTNNLRKAKKRTN